MRFSYVKVTRLTHFHIYECGDRKKIESAYEKNNDQLHSLYMQLRLCLERRLGLPLQPKLSLCEHEGREERV